MNAHQKLISRIRSTTLDKAGLTPYTKHRLVARLFAAKGTPLQYDRTILAAKACGTTIGECIDNYGAMMVSGTGRDFSALDKLRDRLVKLGMNHLDWNALPPETVSDQLPKLPKSQILLLDIRVLGAFTAKAMFVIGNRVLKRNASPHRPQTITIAELVANVSLPRIHKNWHGSIAKSFFRAKARLEALGFGYEDGPFFQEGTSLKMAEYLAHKYEEMTIQLATTIVSIACKEGWINPPLG